MITGAAGKRDVASGTWAGHAAIIGMAASAVLLWQFIFPGYYHKVMDDPIYAQKLFPQFVEALKQGVLYPRWTADSFHGYGLPSFVYYPPLLYLSTGILSMAGTSLSWSLTILRFLCLFAGGVFIYFIVKERYGERAGLIAAVAYTLLPTRILDLYYINTPAGRFSEVFLPMSLFFTSKYMKGPFSRRHAAGMSLSYAALVFSHLPTAYVFTPFLAAYGSFSSSEHSAAKRVLRMSLGLAAGIGICSVFLLPVLLERGLVHIDILLEHTYARNFVFNFTDVKPFEATEQLRSMLQDTVTVELALTAGLLYIAKRRGCLELGRETRFFLLSFLICLFMMSSISGFLWENIPGLKTIQFPFRFNPLYLVFLPLFLGPVLVKLSRPRTTPVFLTAIMATALVLVGIYDASLIRRSSPPVTDADVRPLTARFDMREYLPKTVDPKALNKLGDHDPLLSSREIYESEIITWRQMERVFMVSSSEGTIVRVKTFYFPGWRAWVDGGEAGIGVEDKTGAMLIDVPKGRHEIALRFTDTPVRTVGKAVSIVTLALLVFPYEPVRRRLKLWRPV